MSLTVNRLPCAAILVVRNLVQPRDSATEPDSDLDEVVVGRSAVPVLDTGRGVVAFTRVPSLAGADRVSGCVHALPRHTAAVRVVMPRRSGARLEASSRYTEVAPVHRGADASKTGIIVSLVLRRRDPMRRRDERQRENGGAKIDHRIGGMKPPAGGGKPDRSSGPPSIPRVFCGTREGCIEWSSMRMCGVVSMWKG